MWRFGFGFTLLSCLSFACFLLFPVTGPRPLNTGHSWLYQTVVLCDKPLNSFPSLHAGLLAYTLAFGWRMTRQWVPRWAVVAMLIWAGLILYSTMATKEHYAIDLFAGGVLALTCDAIAWRGKTEAGPIVEPRI
jgi:membrane-associated phospholipid phosphatase